VRLELQLNVLTKRANKIREIFQIRNKIIHELDVRFNVKQGQKVRNPRIKQTLDEMSDLLLQIADDFIKAVNKKLESK